MDDDERAIRELVQNWMSATKAGDLQAVLDMMADDVIFVVAGREPFGKEEFAANSNRLKNVQIDGTANIREIKIHGDWALLRNHLEVSTTAEGKPSLRRSGYTLTVLRKDTEGRWVIWRDANLVA
jgi:uncharacterized protein (TIGR02246 family)